jgi:CRISPR-associated protein Cas1
MPERYRFEGRSRQPAKDEFNCLLNYGYGVLYSMVEKACLVAGLDPYVGFVRTDNYNKKSLVFDLMEMFRYLTDQTVVYLFTGRKVKQEWFEAVPGGMTLAKDGKAALIEALNETFETSVRYRNQNIKQRDIIQFECHRIANGLIKEAGDADLGGVRCVGDAETDEDCQGLSGGRVVPCPEERIPRQPGTESNGCLGATVQGADDAGEGLALHVSTVR